MTRRISSQLLLSALIAAFTLVACASSAPKNTDPNTVLRQTSSKNCERGFIRPPGVRQCLNLTDLVAGKIRSAAPVGKCPQHWQKKSSRSYCLPKYSLVGCGKDTFKCGREGSDSFKVTPGPLNCPEGTIVVGVSVPLFDQNGATYLGARPAIACGPVGKIDPV